MALGTHTFRNDKLCFSFQALPMEASGDVSRMCNRFYSLHDVVSTFEIISHRMVMN
jgi:hypothetical protein